MNTEEKEKIIMLCQKYNDCFYREDGTKDEIIQPSNSPHSSPVWVMPKNQDASGKKKWRMVIDYRKLNDVTIEDKYPLPRMEDILENLGKCAYFTTLDLAQGFHQIKFDKESIEKKAFTVENGHYE